MVKKRFIVEIEVDEKTIAKKYPNWRFNYAYKDGEEDFIKFLMKDFIYEGATDMSKDGLKEWGYAKRIIREVK